MAFNRLVDFEIDSRNPRTSMRHLPTGLLSRGFAWGFVAVASVIFFLAAFELNRLCLRLAPVALGIRCLFYSFTKRFTSFSHLVLGFCLGIAPAAAWIAVRGSLDPRILWLTAAVMFWTAGFDVIYSCQDYEFDIAKGSGACRAHWASPGAAAGRAGDARADGGLPAGAGLGSAPMGALALAGVGAIVALLIYEHSLVKPHDLSRVNAAFFTMNGYVSVLFFLFWAADISSSNRVPELCKW
jgi:4-hydroxybenzoate polyprenyltransferase